MNVQEKITAHVASGIKDGHFPPGSRLKGREAFCRRFKTTPVTVQRAFNRLVKDGLVTSVKSSGTFVAERPPCLWRYALVFPDAPGREGWTCVQQTVLDNIGLVKTESGVDPACFTGLGLKHEDPAALATLDKVVAHRTLAGLVFLSELHNFHREAWARIDLPFYVIAQPGSSQGHPRIELDKASFYQCAAETFARLGRKRIAIAGNDRFIETGEARVKAAFARQGLAYCEELVQTFTVSAPSCVDRFVALLFSLPRSKRPDGLFIIDDNLLEQAYGALSGLGLEPGKDLDIVCHANFPTENHHPHVHRLGYNVPLAVARALANLHANRTCPDIIQKAALG